MWTERWFFLISLFVVAKLGNMIPSNPRTPLLCLLSVVSVYRGVKTSEHATMVLGVQLGDGNSDYELPSMYY
jgi:hypothetical protein